MNLRASALQSTTSTSLPSHAGQTQDSISLLSRAVAAGALALTVETFLLISVGGVVRNAGAGLSCPDWPLCFGRVVPPMDYRVFLEWFHRLMAGSISVFLLAISTYVVFKPTLRKTIGWNCVAAIGLLAAQVILGGLTVLGLLDPKWVSSHLAVALGFFGVVVVTTLKLYDAKNGLIRPIQTSRLSAAAVITSMILFGQILLGGLVSSNYAGLACADFPKCNGQWLPVLEGLVGYQVLHRIGAVAATIALTGFSILAWTRMPSKGRAGLALRTIPALLLLQLLLGVGSVFFQLPLPMSVAHLATATCMWAMMLVVTYEIRRGY